jgi:hypothetical protein
MSFYKITYSTIVEAGSTLDAITQGRRIVTAGLGGYEVSSQEWFPATKDEVAVLKAVGHFDDLTQEVKS